MSDALDRLARCRHGVQAVCLHPALPAKIRRLLLRIDRELDQIEVDVAFELQHREEP